MNSLTRTWIFAAVLAVWSAALSMSAAPVRLALILAGIGGLSLAFYMMARTQARELARSRAAVEAAERAKSLFLANMGQELRTPLHAIIDYSAMAVEVLEADDEAGELTGDLKRIGAAGRHLLGVIDGVLDLSRAETGRMRLIVESFDVAAAVREVADTAERIVAENGNTFDIECPRDLGIMRSDPTKLRQILLTLLSNAAKYTERGHVSLSASRSADGMWIAFEVKDDGAGIAEDQIGRLFQPFAFIEESGAHKHGGSGLSLALGRRFSALMGGDIEVRSSRGTGSTFTVRLPAAVPEFGASGVFLAPAVSAR